MNLGHLLSSVCSSGNFTVTQAGASLYTKLSIFMRADFCCKLLAKSHTLTAIMALWHSYILLAGSGCKSRLHYLSAKTLLTVCSLASCRLRGAESGLGADHGASSLITDMGPWSQVSPAHRGPCLHDSHRVASSQNNLQSIREERKLH